MSWQLIGDGLGIAALLTAILIYSRVHGVEASVQILKDANEGLVTANGLAVAEREQMRAQFTQKLHEQELDCQTKLSVLDGKMDVLVGDFGDHIAARVTESLIARELIVANATTVAANAAAAAAQPDGIAPA